MNNPSKTIIYTKKAARFSAPDVLFHPLPPGQYDYGKECCCNTPFNEKKCFVRFFSAAPFLLPFDIYINGNLFISGTRFCNFSRYFPASPGNYDITAYPSKRTGIPILSNQLRLFSSQAYTLAIALKNGIYFITPIDDCPPAPLCGHSYIRFINLAEEKDSKDIYINGKIKLYDLEFGEKSKYLQETAETCFITVKSAGEARSIDNTLCLALKRNLCYSLYIVKDKKNAKTTFALSEDGCISYFS